MWWKVFDVVPGWVYAVIVAALLVFSGLFYVRMNKAITGLATYKLEVAENTRRAEAAARRKEKELQEHADKIAKDLQARQAEHAATVANSRVVTNSLRNEITRLNARPVPTNPELATCFREASTARELLGTCAERYRELAEEADGIRIQLTGFQEFAKSIRER